MIPNADGPPRHHSHHGPLATVLAEVPQRNLVGACWAGHLPALKALRPTLKDARKKHNLAFRIACEKGYLNMAQWLWSLGLTLEDAQDAHNTAFGSACLNGHLEVALWLYTLGPLTEDWTLSNTAFYTHNPINVRVWFLLELGVSQQIINKYNSEEINKYNEEIRAGE